MNWSRMHTLVAGVTLIALSNAVALSGVVYNRTGEPESALRVTQRELALPYRYGADRESGGMELTLRWRTLSKNRIDFNYPGYGGEPEWLDRAKLAALGFDLTLPENSTAGQRRYERLQSKDVFIALELDGPAYQEALRRAQRWADEAATRDKPRPGAEPPADMLKREQVSASRLFAIDAALDPATLRAKYPDRHRYAIVRARVHSAFVSGNTVRSAQLSGRITKVINDTVSVPSEFRTAFENRLTDPRERGIEPAPGALLEATIAFGRRFEPWLISASAGK